MTPKGKLIIVGGHEDKGQETPGENLVMTKKRASTQFEILKSIILNIPHAHHMIEIIASASSIPDEMGAIYINAYKAAGFTNVGIIRVDKTDEASDPENIKRVHNAHAVFFTGGDQEKLTRLLAETPLMEAITKKYYSDPHFMVGGTSAGAMAMPEIIIGRGIVREALYRDDIKMESGFGVIKNVLVDTHFVKRGRFGRLAHAVALYPECLGIGLEENTALIISEGNHAECIGTGMVILIDGSTMSSTNARAVDENTAVVVDGLKVTILAEGSTYLLKERKMLS